MHLICWHNCVLVGLKRCMSEKEKRSWTRPGQMLVKVQYLGLCTLNMHNMSPCTIKWCAVVFSILAMLQEQQSWIKTCAIQLTHIVVTFVTECIRNSVSSYSWAKVGMDFGIGYTRGAPPMCPTSQIHCHTHLFLHIPKAISVQPIWECAHYSANKSGCLSLSYCLQKGQLQEVPRK